MFYDVFSHVTDLVAHVPEFSMNNFDAFFCCSLIWMEVAIIIDNTVKSNHKFGSLSLRSVDGEVVSLKVQKIKKIYISYAYDFKQNLTT